MLLLSFSEIDSHVYKFSLLIRHSCENGLYSMFQIENLSWLIAKNEKRKRNHFQNGHTQEMHEHPIVPTEL